MSANPSPDPMEKLVNAYDSMMEHVHELLHKGNEKAGPAIKEAVVEARERMVSLGELTREEAEKISDYLERDLKEAATFIQETGQDFREWFRFDVELIEKRFLDLFVGVADQTSIQLRQWAEQAKHSSTYKTGEVTGPGTLTCKKCNVDQQFHKTTRIHQCPNCGGGEFKRK
ncbi:MAG: zinc ribbon-containing protein [bacterium]